MAITPAQYPLLIEAPMLQEYFVDKTTGAPLSGGIVTFYQDAERSFLKNVYYQTGIPGSYTYIPAPNPMILSSLGTPMDNGGNDIILLYFPYDETNDSVIQTYYITVYSANSDGSPAVLQFTRENFPFITNEDNPDVIQQDYVNLISNGQFTAHNNQPNAGLFPNGTTDIVVAPGGEVGWLYSKPNTSTDTDFVTFTQILQEPSNLSGNPRFAINLSCTNTAGSDTFKNLHYRFNNVNRFASENQFYTFSFAAISNAATGITVNYNIKKYFGSGGSASTTTTIDSFTILAGQWAQFSIPFVFGLNNSSTIGTNNDDYVEVVLSLPPNAVFNASFTNFILTPGNVTITAYPERPDNDVFATGIVGSLPTPATDGSSYYLPIVATPYGATFDTSVIGRVEAIVGSANGNGNLLLMDNSTYLTAGYSSLGIPYSRLQAYYMSQGVGNIPLYGTGTTYITANPTSGVPQTMRLTTNQPGAQTAPADGTIPTGFSFSVIHTGQASGIVGYCSGSISVTGINNDAGSVTTATAGTSPFTVSQVSDNPLSYGIIQISCTAASSITAGQYFTFGTPSTNYYMWFKINGAGADPAPGGTGIQVNLLSTYNATEVANCVREAMSGYQITSISCTAASAITAGSYFTFTANSVTYAVWYKKAGVGSQPSVPGVSMYIQVTLAGTETNAQVFLATQLAINSVYFNVGDFRGLFLRGLRGSGQFDLDAATRFSQVSTCYGNRAGTMELDGVGYHRHLLTFLDYSTIGPNNFDVVTIQGANALHPEVSVANETVNNTGLGETRVINTYVNYYVRY